LEDQQNEGMEQLIADETAEIAAVLTETMFPDDNATNNVSQNVSLQSLRQQGGHNCGFDFLQQPTLLYEQDHFITFQHQNDSSLDEATVQLQSNHVFLPEPITHKRLF
jgi:hypothetical protein